MSITLQNSEIKVPFSPGFSAAVWASLLVTHIATDATDVASVVSSGLSPKRSPGQDAAELSSLLICPKV